LILPRLQDSDEVSQAKAIAAKAGVGLITYPLTFSKTLFQLGFEPVSFDI
jgi:hypothetical protein